MAFIKGIGISKEEADVAHYRERITSKLQELKETILDMDGVSALKTIEINMGKVFEGTKEKVLGGHAKKRVAVEETACSHKPWSGAQGASETSPGASVSEDTRVGKPACLEMCTLFPPTCLPNLSFNLQVLCETWVGQVCRLSLTTLNESTVANN